MPLSTPSGSLGSADSALGRALWHGSLVLGGYPIHIMFVHMHTTNMYTDKHEVHEYTARIYTYMLSQSQLTPGQYLPIALYFQFTITIIANNSTYKPLKIN